MKLEKHDEKFMPNRDSWKAIMVRIDAVDETTGNRTDSEWFTFSKAQIEKGRWKGHVENYFEISPPNDLIEV